MNPTEKQLNQINKRIKLYGEKKIQSYIQYFFPDADLKHLSRQEAQKIITGIQLPAPPITGVYGRDFHPIQIKEDDYLDYE